MAESNTQGAPAEGLGQNISFAFKPGSGVPVLQPVGQSQVQAGIRGGPVTALNALRPQQQDPYATQTLDFLVQVGGAVLKPKIEQAKMERYVAGMQQAATGDAMQDIVERQPWYSRIFGDSDTVEGARAYTSEAVANKLLLDMQADMPRLREMDPGTVQAEYSRRMAAVLTGDKATDAAIMASLMRGMPAFMRLQAKEHYAWRQERASAAESEAFRTHAATMQALGVPYQSGLVSDEDYAEAQRRFLLSQLPAAGRDPESWKKDMTARLIGAARDGQFHALNVLRSRPEEGAPTMLELLDDEQRVRVEAAITAAETRAKADAGSRYMDRWAEIVARSKVLPQFGGLTAQQVRDQIDALNADWMKETGVQSPLIAANTAAGTVENALTEALKNNEATFKAHKAAARTAATEQAKADALGRAIDTNVLALRTSGEFLPGSTAEDVRLAWARVKSQVAGKGEEGQAEYLRVVHAAYNADPSKADEGLMTQLQSGIRQAHASGNPDAIIGPYMLWSQLRAKAPDLADHYAGDFAKDMLRLDSALSSTVPQGAGSPEVARAFQSVFMEPQFRGRTDVPTATRKELLADVADWSQGKMNAITRVLTPYHAVVQGETLLRPEDVARLTDAIAPTVVDLVAAGQSKDAAVKGALQTQRARGLELFGGTMWRRGPNDTPFEQFLDAGDPTTFGPGSSVPRAEHHRVTKWAIEAKLAEANIGIADYALIRTADEGGVPQFLIFATDDQGRPFHTVLTGNDIKAQWRGKKESAAEEQRRAETARNIGVEQSIAPSRSGAFGPFQ